MLCWWSEWCSVTCVSSIFISLICVVCKWSFSPLCKLFQVYYVTCVETSLPYSDVLKYSMLSDILVLLSIPPSIAPYFRLMWICFHLNLEVVVVDYYDSTHHSIFLGILFWSWKEHVPLNLYRFTLTFVLITNSFGSYLNH